MEVTIGKNTFTIQSTPWMVNMAIKKRWWHTPPELPKDNDAIPDGLGVGVYEWKDSNGDLQIILKSLLRVSLGKYAEPKPDGSLYYVSRKNGALVVLSTQYFDHLIPAVAYIMELKDKLDES